VRVYADAGQSIDAVTYVASRQGETAKPSTGYLSLKRKGYEEWGLI
jgi:hypothetical protein